MSNIKKPYKKNTNRASLQINPTRRSERLGKKIPPEYSELVITDKFPEKKSEVHRLTEENPSSLKKFKCDSCNEYFSFRNSLVKHYTSRHTSTVFRCTVCADVFKRKDSLGRHMNSLHKTQTNEHMCKVCGKGFKYKYNVLKHIRDHHT